MSPHKRNRRILALGLLLASIIFVGDLFIPLDIAGGVLYVLAVLVTIWHSSRHAATVVAVFSTGFLFLGSIIGEPSGSAFVDVLNRVLGLLSVWLTALLVQERKAAEDALMDSERYVRSILNGTADAIVSIDETGQIRASNPAAGKIFGYDSDELVGRPITQLAATPFATELTEYIRDVHAGRANGVGREVIGQRCDGTTFPMHVRLGDESLGDEPQITAILRDVSAQRQLEQELLAVADEERSRVGYHLHEGLGQMLTGIGLITRNLHQKLGAECHSAADEALQIIEFLREADQYAKDLSQGLIPVDGDETALSYALQRLAAHTSEKFGVACDFRQVGGRIVVHDHALAAHLYQIAQEATSMLAQYARPKTIYIHLAGSASHASLSIRHVAPEIADDEAIDRWHKILSYRARVVGAMLRIRRRQSGGLIRCTIPLRPVVEEEAAKRSVHDL